MTPDKLMTLEEAAKYLDIHPGTLYRWAQKKKLPASKIGRIWRFRKERVNEWLERQENTR